MIFSGTSRGALGLLVLAAAIGCGSEDSSAPGATGGSAGQAGAGGQAGSGGGQACDPSAPFGAPVPIAATTDPAGGFTWCARLSANGLDLYFTGDVPNQSQTDLFRVSRSTTTADFAGPWTPLAVSTSEPDECAFETPDGSTLLFNRGGDIYVSTRASPSEAFTTATPLAGGINTAEKEQIPWLAGDELWYVTWLPEGDPNDPLPRIFRSMREPNGDFGPGAQIDELHQAGSEEFAPVLTGDGLTLYFSRVSPGESLDIWVATRPSLGAPFEAPSKVTELSSDNYEMLGWISPDGCTAYLDSNRAQPEWNVFVASRPPAR
jgi:hypothetical protein